MFTADLQWKHKTSTQNIYVVEGMHKALLGNPAIDELHLISRVESVKGSIDYRAEYPDLFHGLGKMEVPYKISLKDDAQPFAINVPRRIVLPLVDKTKKELRRTEDVMCNCESRTTYRLVCPMVVVPKKDDVRICVDLTKFTESVRRERHDIPYIEYTLGQLSDARIFSKLDANSGFWQVPLAGESAFLTTFITPFGRFCFKRLPFGISSAPEHFQRRTSAFLEGIDGVLCQMDDILIFGATQSMHDEHIREVLRRPQKENVTLNSKKCQFSVQEVKFLGQTINELGISPDQDKVKAIIEMPEPTESDVSGSRRFLGMINQLGKYTPHLAESTKPMRDLLSKKNDWTWWHAQQMCFVAQLKESLTSAPVSRFERVCGLRV